MSRSKISIRPLRRANLSAFKLVNLLFPLVAPPASGLGLIFSFREMAILDSGQLTSLAISRRRVSRKGARSPDL